MDLESLNPQVFKMWELQRNGGPDFFQPSTREDIEEIELLVERPIPERYRDFLLKYSAIGGSIEVGAYFSRVISRKGRLSLGTYPWCLGQK